MNLNRLLKVRRLLVALKRLYYVRIFGMDLHPTVQFSLSAYLDRTYPQGVHVAAHSWIALKVVVLTHDRTRGVYRHTYIGRNCFIGACSVVLPGVRIGDNVIVAAGSVVARDTPDRCIVAGNPAKVIRENIDVIEYGRFRDADDTERKTRASADFGSASRHQRGSGSGK